MTNPRIPIDEIVRRGQEIYEHSIRDAVETPENIGKRLVLDIETGEYEIDSDGLAASHRLRAKLPDAEIYGLRIGYNAVYSLGGALKRTVRE